MAFRIRRADAATIGPAVPFATPPARSVRSIPRPCALTPRQQWRSPRTGIDYPVAFRVEAGPLDITLVPLLEDQELDSRTSVGTVYWEGAVRRSPAVVKWDAVTSSSPATGAR
jgi:predicted secreted hydrolase